MTCGLRLAGMWVDSDDMRLEIGWDVGGKAWHAPRDRLDAGSSMVALAQRGVGMHGGMGWIWTEGLGMRRKIG